MQTRTAGFLLGLVVVAAFGLVLSVVYPVTTAEPYAANPPGDRFTASPPEAYSATGSIVVDGEVELAFEGVVTPDGAWYQRVVEDNVTTAAYRPTANGPVYERLTVVGRDRAERLREEIVEDVDRELVREHRDGEQVTFVLEQNVTGVTEPVSGTAAVVIGSLSVAGYEADGTGPPGPTVYEPQSGWYEGSEPYHIADASGEVVVDTERDAVTSANVSWDLTVPAGTYAEYVLARVASDDPTTHRITFELDAEDYDLERPAWIDETDSA